MPRWRVSVVPSVPVTETVTSTSSTFSFPLLHRHFHFPRAYPCRWHRPLRIKMSTLRLSVVSNMPPVRPLSFLVLPIISEVLIFPGKEAGGGGTHAISINFSQSEMEDESSLSMPTSTDQDINSNVEPVIPRNEGATSDFPLSFSLYSNTLSSITPSRRRGKWDPRGER